MDPVNPQNKKIRDKKKRVIRPWLTTNICDGKTTPKRLSETLGIR